MESEIGPRRTGELVHHDRWTEVPVGHSTNTDQKNNRYFDASDGRPSPRWRRWIEDVKTAGCMVIQKSKLELRSDGRPVVHCVGYLGLYKVADVEFSKAGVFSCKIEKIKDIVR